MDKSNIINLDKLSNWQITIRDYLFKKHWLVSPYSMKTKEILILILFKTTISGRGPVVLKHCVWFTGLFSHPTVLLIRPVKRVTAHKCSEASRFSPSTKYTSMIWIKANKVNIISELLNYGYIKIIHWNMNKTRDKIWLNIQHKLTGFKVFIF